MSLTPFEFLILALAVFRLTHLLVFDTICEFIRKPFQNLVEEKQENGETVTFVEPKGRGIQRFIGTLISCYWCMGVWCALFLYAGVTLYPVVFHPVLVILALAALAAMLEAWVKSVGE
ncbi:DUF1360 domain-containing protein [Alkalihalobacillus oceani]|uniref:DUF1360 domain-containing protein n=1 Tax=Halalkalibacter oceani TaxID=1653776 RepID=UPI0020409CCF|nr:DUF1360 domain-containing protein [Halalkalibacter oceani]MCM3761886.1 DUF1360 domain-containing protein [Halalkalibacter oceani]